MPDIEDPSVTVSVDIAAAPEQVWQVLTDFERYAAWHPTLSVRGAGPRPRVGARLELRLAGGAAGDQEFTAELVEVDAPVRLVWEGGLTGVFVGRHSFALTRLPGGATRLTESERWTGALARTVVARHRAELEAEYARGAEALRAAAETGRA